VSDSHHEESFWRKYIFSTDHKTIGIQYGITALLFLFFGFSLMMVMRWQLAFPDQPVPVIGGLIQWLAELNGFASIGNLPSDLYNVFGAMHGTIMIFLGVVPLVVGAFGNYIVPLQIGAPDMAFPKLNMTSYWVYFIGGVIMLVSFFLPGGAANSGCIVAVIGTEHFGLFDLTTQDRFESVFKPAVGGFLANEFHRFIDVAVIAVPQPVFHKMVGTFNQTQHHIGNTKPVGNFFFQLLHHLIQVGAGQYQSFDFEQVFLNFFIGTGNFEQPFQFAFKMFFIIVNPLDNPVGQTQRTHGLDGQVIILNLFDFFQ